MASLLLYSHHPSTSPPHHSSGPRAAAAAALPSPLPSPSLCLHRWSCVALFVIHCQRFHSLTITARLRGGRRQTDRQTDSGGGCGCASVIRPHSKRKEKKQRPKKIRCGRCTPPAAAAVSGGLESAVKEGGHSATGRTEQRATDRQLHRRLLSLACVCRLSTAAEPWLSDRSAAERPPPGQRAARCLSPLDSQARAGKETGEARERRRRGGGDGGGAASFSGSKQRDRPSLMILALGSAPLLRLALCPSASGHSISHFTVPDSSHGGKRVDAAGRYQRRRSHSHPIPNRFDSIRLAQPSPALPAQPAHQPAAADCRCPVSLLLPPT